MGISEMNARKMAEKRAELVAGNVTEMIGSVPVLRYTWEDVRELALEDGYSAGYCPVCGDLCVGQPGADPVLEGYAQRDNAGHQGQCLDLIYGLER
jgi:hypothetical protein